MRKTTGARKTATKKARKSTVRGRPKLEEKKKLPCNLTLDRKMAERAKAFAALDGMSLSELVNEVLGAFVEQREREMKERKQDTERKRKIAASALGAVPASRKDAKNA